MIFAFGCEQRNENPPDSGYLAKIVGFDMNCSTCFLSFPEDSLTIIKEIGESEENYYHAINLGKDTFRTGQYLNVKLREPLENEYRACKTMYPSFDYRMIFVTHWNPIE